MMFNSAQFLSCDDGPIAPSVMLDLDHLMWDHRVVTIDDKQRWLSQGIHTAMSSFGDRSTSSVFNLDEIGAYFHQWGLVQNHGGPCGVLAAIQSELLALILFGHDIPCNRLFRDTEYNKNVSLRGFPNSIFFDDDSGIEKTRSLVIDSTLTHRAMATALGWILARAALASVASDDDDDDDIEAIFLQAKVRLVVPSLPSSLSCESPYLQKAENGFHQKAENPVPPSNKTSSSLRCINLMLLQKSGLISHSNCQPLADTVFDKIDCSSPESFRVHIMSILAYCVADYLQSSALNHFFDADDGVIRFTQSLILTRGIMRIQRDMDDPLTTHLTSQFGQCSQELMNLTLTGQAVSNVFDHTLTLYNGSVQCRGISSQVHIGYLTQLEALRYCQVGSYFKSPQFPIWIIGSQSHFSVLFSASYDLLKEDSTQALLNQCRRAFTSIPSAEENGFIASSSLGVVFGALRLPKSSRNPTNFETNCLKEINESNIEKLVAHLEIPGSGIIIWDDFWRTTSRLMTGVPLNNILQGEAISINDSARNNNTNFGLSPERTTPLMLTQYGESDFLSVNNKTDEEIARELQLLYDQEMNASVIDNQTLSSSSIQPNPKVTFYGEKFRLYFYNGLRGGTLSSFFVIPSDSHEAVGTSVALAGSSSPSSAYLGYTQNTNSSTPSSMLEIIIKTKWPSCKIDWCGSNPPNID